MLNNRYIALFAVLACALAAVLLTRTDCNGEPGDDGRVPLDAGVAARDGGVSFTDAVATDTEVAWIVAEPSAGSFVALHDGEPVESEFVIGAAGVYPPLRTTGVGIALPSPAPTMSGESVDTVEVYAWAVKGELAFWGDVEVDANAVELLPATSATVRVVDTDGAPIEGVEVRLARRVVGLVVLSARTDDRGVATFPLIPPGEYVASGDIGGASIGGQAVVAGQQTTLFAARGHEVHGVVRGDGGKPVADAIVSVYGAGLETDPTDDVPSDIVRTNLLGEYRVQGVRGAQFAVVALADRYAPTSAAAPAAMRGPTRIDVALRRGNPVAVAVVDDSGTPVGQAKVEWRDAETDTGAATLTDAAGLASFVGVPANAEVFARFNQFESGRVALESLSPSPDGYEVELRLAQSDGRLWRTRVEVPSSVTLRDLDVYDETGVRCGVTTNDNRDFIARGCGDGDALFRARTDRGLVEWSPGPFVDGATVTLPEPTPVTIEVQGELGERWETTMFEFVGPVALVPIQVAATPGGRVVSTAVYPGDWRLIVSNTRVGRLPFAVPVGDDPVATVMQLAALHRFRAEVVDAYGAPVTGAYAMLFDNDGSLVDVARSAGQLPTEFRVRPPFNGELIVVDPRRGEGRATLQTSGESDVRVRLREPVLSLPVPTSRPSREQVARRTGAKLVPRDQGWVLDFEQESAGTRAGLRRGDLLVTAWPDGGGLRVVVRRSGEGFVDVVVR